MSNVDFLGFIGENTIGEIRYYFECTAQKEGKSSGELLNLVGNSIKNVYVIYPGGNGYIETRWKHRCLHDFYSIIINIIGSSMEQYEGMAYNTMTDMFSTEGYCFEDVNNDVCTVKLKDIWEYIENISGFKIKNYDRDKDNQSGYANPNNPRYSHTWEKDKEHILEKCYKYKNVIKTIEKSEEISEEDKQLLFSVVKGIPEYAEFCSGRRKRIEDFKAQTKQIAKNKIINNVSFRYEQGTIAGFLQSEIDRGRKQIIFTGAPGTGKTHDVLEFVKKETGGDQARYEFVQFHSSYDYTDFVEGLRPVVISNEKSKEVENNSVREDNYSFVRVDGIFKEFCRRAEKDNNSFYYFIIDEINRANLSKVFGELMFLLEENYRGSDHRIKTQYHNLPTYRIGDNGKAELIPMQEDSFNSGFYIPENIIIIGTMNDIDRSVETFDFALRRRFQWTEVKAVDSLHKLEDIYSDRLADGEEKNNCCELIRKCAEAINAVIGENYKDRLGESFQLGVSYFAHFSTENLKGLGEKDIAKTVLEEYFDNELKPILVEYSRGKNSLTNLVTDCKEAFTKDLENENVE